MTAFFLRNKSLSPEISYLRCLWLFYSRIIHLYKSMVGANVIGPRDPQLLPFIYWDLLTYSRSPSMQPIELWLLQYVNDPRFAAKLQADIESMDPKDQIRLRLELMSYLVPKVKTVDPAAEKADREISVVFQEDTKGTAR